ncbi:MAG: Sua5/YciO/YrdC/YwlC family protein [Saprospiraceae bacterium]|nr:Sua5/YciO/YrdC/YwlC family protein [Lewinellaceae bacterium]
MFLLRDDISEIARLLEAGGLICYPTDTVWGIGCDATNDAAIERLTKLKGYEENAKKGYVLLVDGLPMLNRFVPEIHPKVQTLLAYHMRPLTIIYKQALGLPESVKAANGSVAIRIAKDAFCQELIKNLGKPIVSTIAAKANEPFPPTFGAISSEILGGVDYVVKYRQDDKEPHEPSSMAYLDGSRELEFLRD